MLSVHVGEVSGGHHAKYENTEALQLHSSAYLPENGKQRIHKRKMQKKKEDADERTHVDGLKALYTARWFLPGKHLSAQPRIMM